MSKSILQNIPDAHQLLGLDTEELAGYVLEHLHARGGNPLKQGDSLPHNLANDLAPRYAQNPNQVYNKIIAACHWLINNGFLDIINQQGFYEISNKGNKFPTADLLSELNIVRDPIPVDDLPTDGDSTTEMGPSANRLYEKVKSLINSVAPLDEDTARVIVESADDAIKEFGSTNQEKKVELRQWKLQAESVLPPATVEELRKRGERLLLRKSYPTHVRLRNFLLVLVGITVLAGAIGAATGYLTKLTSLFSASSPTVPQLQALVEVTNAGKTKINIQDLCEFYLTEDKG